MEPSLPWDREHSVWERLLPSLGCLGVLCPDSSMVFLGPVFPGSALPSLPLTFHSLKSCLSTCSGLLRRSRGLFPLEPFNAWSCKNICGSCIPCLEGIPAAKRLDCFQVGIQAFWWPPSSSGVGKTPPRGPPDPKKSRIAVIFLCWPMEKWCREIHGSKQLILRTRLGSDRKQKRNLEAEPLRRTFRLEMSQLHGESSQNGENPQLSGNVSHGREHGL